MLSNLSEMSFPMQPKANRKKKHFFCCLLSRNQSLLLVENNGEQRVAAASLWLINLNTPTYVPNTHAHKKTRRTSIKQTPHTLQNILYIYIYSMTTKHFYGTLWSFRHLRRGTDVMNFAQPNIHNEHRTKERVTQCGASTNTEPTTTSIVKKRQDNMGCVHDSDCTLRNSWRKEVKKEKCV